MKAELEALREAMTRSEEHAKTATGSAVRWSETGPVGHGLIRALIAVVEAQAKEIERLKRKPTGAV